MALSHVLLMTVYSLLVSAFFAVLWKRQRRAQMTLFLKLFLGMVLGAVVLAWIMYPFPAGPPAPFP